MNTNKLIETGISVHFSLAQGNVSGKVTAVDRNQKGEAKAITVRTDLAEYTFIKRDSGAFVLEGLDDNGERLHFGALE